MRTRSFHIRIEGHTDNVPIRPGGGYSTNMELSGLRAASVVEYMIRQYGIDPTTISFAGYGQYKPIAENVTSEGRRKNRRVDIVILSETAKSLEP